MTHVTCRLNTQVEVVFARSVHLINYCSLGSELVIKCEIDCRFVIWFVLYHESRNKQSCLMQYEITNQSVA